MQSDKLPGMNYAARMCPICGADSRVYDTRETADGTIRHKRRSVTAGGRIREHFRDRDPDLTHNQVYRVRPELAPPLDVLMQG